MAVVGGLQFVQVHAGVTQLLCGLTTAGLAYCWGDNLYGQLGDGDLHHAGTTLRSRSPGLASSRRSGVGFRHSCGLTGAGVAFCWGENAHGELGIGTNTGPQDRNGVPCAVRPVRVAGGHVLRQIVPGGEHTCGLDSDHRYFCWGNNPFGGLGDGTRTTRLTPVRVSGGLLFSQVRRGCVLQLRGHLGRTWPSAGATTPTASSATAARPIAFVRSGSRAASRSAA